MMQREPFLLKEKGFTINYEGPLNVLLVDDKKENLFSLEGLLEDEEYNLNFLKCTSGNEALNIALKENIALILLDVQMPGMDGYEVARFLKENKKTRAIPIIFVTALDQEVSYILEGYKKGAVDYLFKPLNPAITRAKVKAFIHTYLQQKELEQKNYTLENLAMLVNNSVDLMCILYNETLEVSSINPSWTRVLGLEDEALLGKPITTLPGAGESFNMLLNASDEVVLFENELPAASGEKIWFSWSFVRKNHLWYGNGKNITKNKLIESQLETANEELEKKVLERTADLLNVNEQLKDEVDKRSKAEKELKTFNERLLKTNEELDSFVYIASHDLKAPIANIETLFTILEKKLKDKVQESELKLFELVRQSLDKFNATLKDLGKVTSVQKDLQDDYTEVDLKSAFKDATEDIKDLIQNNNTQITTNFEVEHIYYARKHIRSIFYNLMSNAIKYKSPERDPVIAVSTRDEGEYVVIAVKDNGLGLKKNQKEKMFTMFKRFHSHVEGSGVGLYLLKKIISNNGGKIDLESTEGEGTTFYVYLKKV